MKAIRGINSLNYCLTSKLNKKGLEEINKINLNLSKRFFFNIARTELKNKTTYVFIYFKS